MKLTPQKASYLKEKLQPLLTDPILRQHAYEKDPVGVVLQYQNKRDREVVGLIASVLSYGKQSAFRPVILEVIEKALGSKPAEALLESDPSHFEEKLREVKYRFNTGADIGLLLKAMQKICRESELEDLYPRNKNSKEAASEFVKAITKKVPEGGKGFRYLLPNPEEGSACKRLNMFLRWMFRKDEIDPGTWCYEGSTKRLVIPLDTHVARVSLKLGLTERKDTSWKTAEDITESLSYLDEEDPVKYDFALCTSGILKIL